MRRVAIKWDQVTIDADGHIAGHDAGATLVRRLVRLTHNPIVPSEPVITVTNAVLRRQDLAQSQRSSTTWRSKKRPRPVSIPRPTTARTMRNSELTLKRTPASALE